jgi:hypothetical protein
VWIFIEFLELVKEINEYFFLNEIIRKEEFHDFDLFRQPIKQEIFCEIRKKEAGEDILGIVGVFFFPKIEILQNNR